MPEPLWVPPGSKLNLQYRKDLILHHKYNVNSGVLCPDLSGYANNGTLLNVANPPNATSGWAGSQGLLFDGVNDYVDAGNGASLNFTSESFSISLWINPNARDGSLFIIEKGGYVSSCGYDSFLGSNNKLYFRTVQAGPATQSTVSQPLSNGVWQYITIVRNGASITIYRNGVNFTESYGVHINPVTSSYSFHLGARIEGSVTYFNGLINEVRIYKRALSAAEVAHTYFQQEDEWDLGLDDDLAIMQVIPIELMRGGIK